MKLLIYMPAYNEAENIERVIRSLPQKINKISQIDILVINDSSTDNTTKIAQKAGAQVITHKKQSGVGVAFHSAIKFFTENKYDILVSIDADGQFDSNEIPQLVQPLINQEADMVTGCRFSNGKPENMTQTKYIGNKMMAQLVSLLTKTKIKDAACGFRAYNAETLYNLNLFGRFTYTQETILNTLYENLVIKQIPISVQYFKSRKSRVAKSIVNYATKTSSIIFNFLIIHRPFIFSLSLLLIQALVCFIASFTVNLQIFTVILITNILLYVTLILYIIFKNVERIIKNQNRILYKLKRREYE